MAKARSVVGLDVHASKIVAAVVDGETGELQFFEMNGEIAAAAGFCAGLPGAVKVAYEAGPTGYVLARELAERRVECVVAARSKIPRATGELGGAVVFSPIRCISINWESRGFDG